MNKNELSQVVLAPKDESFLGEVRALVSQEEPPPAAAMRRLAIGRFLHRFGLHHWVLLRVYDPQSKRILNTGSYTCAFCPKATLHYR